jgi:hypothetical protein
MKFKLRKGMRLGALAAEHDELLAPAFVDLGHLDALGDTGNPHFLVLGRAGSGKTALLKMLRTRHENVSVLDPDDLSMQYLHNSPILRSISSWGVNLEIFYKYLWRHVCILELIRMRYGDVEDVPGKLQSIFDFAQIWKKDERKTREISQGYLQRYGQDYWLKTDTRIKNITTEIESQLKKDPKISASLGWKSASVSASFGTISEQRVSNKVEQEVVERARSIVSDFQVAALNRVVEVLEEHGFRDEQKHYYLVIDDLDKNWMPDDLLYLELLKSLLFSVNELNGKLKLVKIVVALRDNIYHRVFQKAGRHEPQREKWLDVQIRLHWTKDELIELINSRIREVFRSEYTLNPPVIEQILPDRKKRTQEQAIDFILDRTFMRPRDVIDFINTCIQQSDSFSTLSWSAILRAEAEFSQRRLQSIFDEWKDSYFGLPILFPLLKRLGSRFRFEDINEDDIISVMSDPRAENCEWLSALSLQFVDGKISADQFKVEVLRALFLVGLIGAKQSATDPFVYSFERYVNLALDTITGTSFTIHKMFWHALNIKSMTAGN